MVKLLNIVFVGFLVPFMIIGCGGSSSGTIINPNIQLGTLPTGSSVYININPVNIVNYESANAILSVSGGQQGITYVFTFSEGSNTPVVIPNTCTLTVGQNTNCKLNFQPNLAANGNYNISVSYALVNNNSTTLTNNDVTANNNTLSKPITVIVSGTTHAQVTSPNIDSGVGAGTPIIVQFNNPIESATVNSSTFTLANQNGNLVNPQSITVLPDNKHVIFMFESGYENPLSINTRYTVNLTNGIIDQTGKAIAANNYTFTTQAESYAVFLTESYYNGNLLGAAKALNPQGNFTNGVMAADYLCQRDANRPTNGTYKAMLVDATGQYRSASPTPKDWVFQPYTLYVNAQESPMFITGINPPLSGLNPYNDSVSAVTPNSYSLNKIKSGTGNFITGMATNWTTIINGTCNTWTSADSTVFKAYGYTMSPPSIPYQPYNAVITVSNGNGACNLTSVVITGKFYLLCVEQP